MAIPEQFLDDIRARCRLADVIGRRVRLTRRGNEFHGLCPFHKEKTPSFTVNEEKGFYHCFGCGAHGSLFDFVMAVDGLSFREAVAKLAAEAGLSLPVEGTRERTEDPRRHRLLAVLEAACLHFERQLAGDAGAAARAYLSRRGVGEDIIRRFRLGFADAGKGALRAELMAAGHGLPALIEAGLLIQPPEAERGPYERFRNRVMFPIGDGRGRVIGFGGRLLAPGEPKYLNSPETPLFRKGALLYGLHLAREAARRSGFVIAVEGYMDAIGLHAAGFAEAVAPLGTAVTGEQLALMWQLAPRIIFCFDPDAAGQRAAMRVAERALPLIRSGQEVKIALLRTDGGDDPDQAARRYPRQFLERTLAEAVALSDFLYAVESGGRPPRSPEAAAALTDRLNRRCASMGDGALRRQFLQSFRERLRREMTAERRGDRRRRHPPASPLAPAFVEALPPAPAGRWLAAEKHLLALVLTHPADFPRWEEALGTLAFSDAGFERLRRAVIGLLAAEETLAASDTQARLAELGLAAEVARVLDDPGVRLAAALRADSSREERDAHAAAQLALLRRRSASGELAATPADANSTDEWARRRALIEARLQQEG